MGYQRRVHGTHPIFESDFDCLTEARRNSFRMKFVSFLLCYLNGALLAQPRMTQLVENCVVASTILCANSNSDLCDEDLIRNKCQDLIQETEFTTNDVRQQYHDMSSFFK